jgi:BirA family biotin operon repressor/biotin-[acetyl-CoA-carboxylase] ligase
MARKIDKPNAAAVERLTADRLRAELPHCTIGREIIVLEETTSTNDSILQRATAHGAEGLVIFAERQTAGRGQRSTRWESAAEKGLWLSILLKPRMAIAESSRLTAWAAQAVTQTISEEFALRPTIKSSNDVYIDGKKVAGVLVEMRAQRNAPHFAIVGIGLNVNHSPADFSEELRGRAVSLAMILDRQVDRSRLAVALLRKLDRAYEPLRGL